MDKGGGGDEGGSGDEGGGGDEDDDDDDDDGPNSPLVEEPSLSLLGNGHFDLKLNTTFRKDSQPLAHILFIDF